MDSQNNLLSEISNELDSAIHVLNRIAEGMDGDGQSLAYFMANHLAGMKAKVDAPEEQRLRAVN